MKRSRSQRNKKLKSDLYEEDSSTATTSDSEHGDATYEIDLSELEAFPSSRKRLRADENVVNETETFPSSRKRLRADENVVNEPETFYDTDDIYQDPLDEGGVDLSDIPEDFDKAPGTIERRERIESRWKR